MNAVGIFSQDVKFFYDSLVQGAKEKKLPENFNKVTVIKSGSRLLASAVGAYCIFKVLKNSLSILIYLGTAFAANDFIVLSKHFNEENKAFACCTFNAEETQKLIKGTFYASIWRFLLEQR